ncbi:phosphonoacetaldehyde hydrolase [Pseudomonas helleri]|jgi:phosphonoacetaldehyde hydrolase|uniref:Phosphonoacetaldehyde hydrolase n=1 Tax=Pseudomonas helleri TaxID=1608996 RepID=A0A6A7Z7Q4_9PSED|nr:phosphonoacetaldehyde hydrolase [Pseudomonas helleri]KMN23537.1 phosphonoacetaldehyde hydrolase [Pseudomonas helleri]MQT35214.1 phosphonoacetaldehyde hydrolase [Pseudomonas helleri]MQU20248.1 phosphonoacetaldehyde hydrolase [Pseudomonas helleri]MQU41859.1 phosphonoacetaldehyde hydrolase [Pseudomonas helleri]MQU56926.1 phosphonoacetaldehyde hydrolase [Pseudomonas helleri]
MNYTNPSKLQAAILDWAGTVVDFGSFAPTQIFVEAFAEFDVQVSIEEARGPMGMGKWDHIRTLCDQPQISERYKKVFGRTPSDDDVTAIYQRFMPLQIEKIAEHSALIPGALETIAQLREQGIKIGSCSGYPAQVMAKVVELAATRGYTADHVVATDQVPNGRPWPAQALANVIALGIDDVGACVKVDDTVPGILEGRRAGMWTVALVCSGNALGLTYEQYRALDPATLASERTRIHNLFEGSRPHYLIDTLSDLPEVIADINKRLANGEMPQSS